MNVWQSTNVAFLFLCMFGNLPAQCANALKNPMGSQSSGRLVGQEVLISHILLQNTKIFQPAGRYGLNILLLPNAPEPYPRGAEGVHLQSVKMVLGLLGLLDPNLNLNIPRCSPIPQIV